MTIVLIVLIVFAGFSILYAAGIFCEGYVSGEQELPAIARFEVIIVFILLGIFLLLLAIVIKLSFATN